MNRTTEDDSNIGVRDALTLLALATATVWGLSLTLPAGARERLQAAGDAVAAVAAIAALAALWNAWRMQQVDHREQRQDRLRAVYADLAATAIRSVAVLPLRLDDLDRWADAGNNQVLAALVRVEMTETDPGRLKLAKRLVRSTIGFIDAAAGPLREAILSSAVNQAEAVSVILAPIHALPERAEVFSSARSLVRLVNPVGMSALRDSELQEAQRSGSPATTSAAPTAATGA